MRILESFFDNVLVLESSEKVDNRGTVSVKFNEDEIRKLNIDFVIKEQRIYKMPKVGTFFGIHYQEMPHPQAKLVSVIQGRGLDYVVDLRKDSVTYKEWKMIELNENDSKIIYIPAGYGHAFLSMKDNTIQMFAVDEYFIDGCARQINYSDLEIGLKLPVNNVILSDYDKNAPFLSEKQY